MNKRPINQQFIMKAPSLNLEDITNYGECAEYLPLVMHILDAGYKLCGQSHELFARFSEEVAQVTEQKAFLFISHTDQSPLPESLPNALIHFPIQFNNMSYGKLCILPDKRSSIYPALPFPVAHLLARICGLFLYIFEQTAFMKAQYQKPHVLVQAKLTKREREVLSLMVNGFNQKEIANILTIATTTVQKHRHHIYGELGVHCEKDAVLVAYQSGLISPMEIVEKKYLQRISDSKLRKDA